MNSKRLSLVTAIAVAAIGAFGASAAQANVYCADSPDPSCMTNHTDHAVAVQAAVDNAKNNPGPDTVLIGPGNFTAASAMDLYGSGTGNTVTIIGSGSGTNPATDTILSVSNQAVPTITFDAGAGSSMRDLSFFIDAAATFGGREGLVLRNSFDGEPPTATNLNIYTNPNSYLSGGVVLYSGSDLDNSSVDLATNTFTLAVKVDGQGSEISRSYVAGATGVIQGSNNGDLSVYRTEIHGTSYGITNSSGYLSVNDSLIELSSGNAQSAVEIVGGNTVSGDASFNGSTIIANAGVGIRVRADQGSSDANLFFDSSVLAGAAGTVEVIAAGAGDSAYFGSDSGAFDSSKLSSSGSGSIFIDPVDVADLSTTSPGFADAGAGDYRLAPDSALIDAGQDVDPPEGALDLDGGPRACHGTESGVIRRDIGAFEFRTDPNDDCTYPAASVDPDSGSFIDLTPTFALSSSKAGNEFLCSVDEAAYGPCGASFTTSTLTPGDHTLDVRAKDTFGNIQVDPERATFSVVAPTCETDPSLCPPPTCETDPSLCPPPTCETDPSLCPPPTCETDPSLCPPPDKTAPKVIGLKAPKKAKAKRVSVRFKSNEKGVTFTCKLNKAKAKRCKSPWKTPRLKKGKNTIAIQATDKAGNKSKVVKRVIRKTVRRK